MGTLSNVKLTTLDHVASLEDSHFWLLSRLNAAKGAQIEGFLRQESAHN